MRTAAATLLGALLAVIALTTAPMASAHATRIATDPAINAARSTGPSQVSATFNEHLQPTFAAMTVVGPPADLALAGVQPGAHLDAERMHRVADRHRAADRPLRAIEHREEAVARRVDLAASKACELRPDDGVVGVK